MEVKSLCWDDPETTRDNNPLLPKSIRGLLIGKSGCGKTTLLMNLLMNPGWLDYNKLQVFGKSLFQPEYKLLKKAMEEKLPKEEILKLFDMKSQMQKNKIPVDMMISELAKNIKDKSDVDVSFYENTSDVPDPKKLSSTDKNLMIFDDLQLEKQNKCEAYYVRGRHSNVDCFYLAQNYFKLPRQTIRENANFFAIFPQDKKNIQHFYSDHVSTDMPMDEFKALCKNAWKNKHGFLVIDLTSDKDNGRYRIGLDNFYIPNEEENEQVL